MLACFARPLTRHVLMHSTVASMLMLQKYAMDMRFACEPFSSIGLTTWCGVESQRSFVQRAIRSPRLMTKQFSSGVAVTSIHCPLAPITCRPPGYSPPSRKIVSEP